MSLQFLIIIELFQNVQHNKPNCQALTILDSVHQGLYQSLFLNPILSPEFKLASKLQNYKICTNF